MTMRPVTFGDCFGWLHHGTDCRFGVVICASWEYEAAVVGPALRVFADHLARAGLAALRFDYPGCGDSLRSGDSAEAFDDALASIRTAVTTLRAETGVAHVALAGHRLGAALALEAATTLDVDSLVLISPVLRGRAFLSEQRSLFRILQSYSPVPLDDGADVLILEGFRLNATSQARIKALDLTTATTALTKPVLIAGEDGWSDYDLLNDSLIARGGRVSRYPLAQPEAWAPALIPPPPPFADYDAITTWLQNSWLQSSSLESSWHESSSPQHSTPPTAALPPPQETALWAQDGFQESVVAFGPGDDLIGIMCRPVETDNAGRVVVFLNTGANSHIGAGRAAVHHARDLARRGIASFRIDIKGLGDAAWSAEGAVSAIHQADRKADVAAALDVLQMRGYRDITLVGICSGAFLAFHSALADRRVSRIVLTNPRLWLEPTTEQRHQSLHGTHVTSPLTSYIGKLLRKDTWRRLFKGDLQIARGRHILATVFLRALRRSTLGLSRISSVLFSQPRKPGALASLFAQLHARGCAVLLVLSEGDPAHAITTTLLPLSELKAVAGLRLIEAEGADHNFAIPRTRAVLLALICEFVSA